MDEVGSAQTLWQSLVVGTHYVTLSCCHFTREEIIFSSGEEQGSSKVKWKKTPLVLSFPTPYIVIKHLLYMNLQ